MSRLTGSCVENRKLISMEQPQNFNYNATKRSAKNTLNFQLHHSSPKMFKNTFHSSYRYLSLFYSLGTEPLQLWNKVCTSEGCIDFVIDEQLQSKVLEIRSNQINENYIVSPSKIPTKTLSITLPILVLIVKNVCCRVYSKNIQITFAKI